MFCPRSSLALSFPSSPFSPPVGSAPPSASFAIPANFSRFFTSSRIPVIVVASSRSASRSFPAAACACVFRSFRRSFNSLTLIFTRSSYFMLYSPSIIALTVRSRISCLFLAAASSAACCSGSCPSFAIFNFSGTLQRAFFM